MPYRSRDTLYNTASGLPAESYTPHFLSNTTGQTSEAMFFDSPGFGTDPIFSIGISSANSTPIDPTALVAPAHLDPLINQPLHLPSMQVPVQRRRLPPQPSVSPAARVVPPRRTESPHVQQRHAHHDLRRQQLLAQRPQPQQHAAQLPVHQQQLLQLLPSPPSSGDTTDTKGNNTPAAPAPATSCPASLPRAPSLPASPLPASSLPASLPPASPLPASLPPASPLPGPAQALTPSAAAAAQAVCSDMAATIRASFPLAEFAARHDLPVEAVAEFLGQWVLSPLGGEPLPVQGNHEGEGGGGAK